MITLDQTLEQQRDLDALCADRPLYTNEIFAPNAYYGGNAAIKTYAGLPATYRLRSILPHGVVMSREYVWQTEAKAPLAVVLAPAYRAGAYRSSTSKVFLSSALPFVYAFRLVGARPLAGRAGTLFFPSHSTHRVTSNTDYESLADAVSDLPSRYRPVTVCVYWRDYLLGHHRPFARRGMTVVSAGHMYDADFLFRLAHLFSLHRYAAGNEIGSHAFYAVVAGCEYFHVAGFPATRRLLSRQASGDISLPPDNLDGLAAFGVSSTDAHTAVLQRQLADRLVGQGEADEPGRLHAKLRFAERLDRFGVARSPMGGSWMFAPPYGYWRVIRGAIVRSARAAGWRLLPTARET